MGWKQVTSEAQGGRMLSTMTMDSSTSTEACVQEQPSSTQEEHLLFETEVLSLSLSSTYLLKFPLH